MVRLANVIYPNPDLCMEEHLYYRPELGSWYSHETKTLKMRPESKVFFNTYFNAFSIGKWKKYTDLDDLSLIMEAKGSALVNIVHLDKHHRFHTIYRGEIESSETKKYIYPIERLPNDGILYFEVFSDGHTEISDAFWATDTEPKNKVKLGISITTFNRQDAVKASTKRILNFLHDTDDIDVDLIVVDNGKNVELPEDEKLTLIPNENLGGSGGFARGLYHLKEENNDYTHCLFMDDDASCETESIYRTYRFFQYSNEPKLAIAGAMLLGNQQNMQWENGANFDQKCMPRKSMFDLNDMHRLVDNEDDEPFDYGGWWYFAFPVKYAEYPYPFFVRGDDVNFGLQDQFTQITLNGIGTWGDDFFYKESPLTQYLDTRSHLLHHIQCDRLNGDIKTLLKVFWRFVAKYSMLYRYASAEAQIEALKDVLKGPEFFENNIDMKNVFSKISPLNNEEKPKKIDPKILHKYDCCPHFKWRRLMKIYKALTLNGHLIPKIFFKRKGIYLDKTDHRFGSYFRRKIVLLYIPTDQTGFIVKHDKKRFFSILNNALKISWEFYKNHEKLTSEYKSRYGYLTSKEYWEKQFFPNSKVQEGAKDQS
ncbi:glycosyltransferase [Nitratifractor sp.]